MIIRRGNGLRGTLLLLPLAFLTATRANAQTTVTWSGATGSDWNTAANWSGGARPTNVDTALFNSNVSSVANAVADQSVAGITFDNGAAAITIGGTSGRKLLLTSGGTITYAATLATNSQTINSPLTLLPVDATSAGSYTFTNLKTGTDAATSLKFGGAIAGGTTSSAITLTLGGVNSATNGNRISGVISDGSAAGGVAIVKSGTGRWELTGNNTFTGSVSLNDGVLAISGTGLGSTNAGTTVASGATLAIIGNSTAAEPVTIQGTGVGGTLGALSGGNLSFGGLVSLADDATIKGNSPGNNVFSLTNTGTITGAGRTLTLDGFAQQISVSSVIGIGSGNVIITGSAGNSSNTITLAGINTFTGTTFVQNGTLRLGASGDSTYSPLGTTDAGTVVSNGAKLNLGGQSITTAESLTLNGVGYGNEGVLGGSGTWSGPIILATTSQFGGTGAASNVTIATSSTISGAGGLTLAAGSGGGRIDGTLSMGGSLFKSNSGTWTFSGSNTYVGATSVSGGVLRITHASALGTTAGATTVSNGATLEIDGSGGNLTGIAEAVTLTGSGVSGLGALRNISGNNTITGNITASTTAPRINSDGGTLTLSSAGTYSAGNLLLSVGGSGNVTIDRIINSTQGVTKDGSGVLTMSRLNTYDGVTTIGGGVIAVSEIANGGVASGLGDSSNAAANLVINGGTLRYTGTGGSTNRNFTIGDNNATLDASGSGALVVSGSAAFATSNVARSLTLAGSNTGTNTFASGLTDNGSGAVSLVKTGVGVWRLSGSNSHSGSTTVSQGLLAVNGSLSGTGAVTVAAGATLGGSGSIVGGITGDGQIAPGNSPGIFTAASITPTGSTSFAFEFTQTGEPTWSSATNSGNDVLRLTDLSSPINGTLASTNIVDVYFDMTSIAINDSFRGGFFTDKSGDFLANVGSATYRYYVLGSGSGTAAFHNGQGYYQLDSSFLPGFSGVTVSTVPVGTANFTSGNVFNGQVTQFVIVPEPHALILATLGIGLCGGMAVRRRRECPVFRVNG